MSDLQSDAKPVVIPGAIIQLSGHPARVLKIVRDGVVVQVANRPLTFSFDQIEKALRQGK